MNIGIISQARMGSTRLPGKVLMKIKQKTILEYHIERLRWSHLPIIVATTDQKADELIVSLCADIKTPCFRGDEEDVLKRFYECAVANRFDIIIRVTSDCPLIDGLLIKEGLGLFTKEGVDYLSNTIERSFPQGFDFEIFSFNVLKSAFANAKEKPEREHVTPYIWRNNPEKFKLWNFKNDLDRSNYRLTVDTQEDFLVVKELIEKYGADRKDYKEIISILENNSYISELNKAICQKEYGE
jgi:spore coat polysaccharide biosynthesis protein SpsF